MPTTSGTRSREASILKKICEDMLYGKLPIAFHAAGKHRGEVHLQKIPLHQAGDELRIMLAEVFDALAVDFGSIQVDIVAFEQQTASARPFRIPPRALSGNGRHATRRRYAARRTSRSGNADPGIFSVLRSFDSPLLRFRHAGPRTRFRKKVSGRLARTHGGPELPGSEPPPGFPQPPVPSPRRSYSAVSGPFRAGRESARGKGSVAQLAHEFDPHQADLFLGEVADPTP